MTPHLRFHSEFSLTHGLIRLSGEREIGRLAKERGIAAVALTDTNNICGAIYHYRSCVRHGVKPILGCHALFERNGLDFGATLLCMDGTGFGNLSKILSKAQQEGGGRIVPSLLDPAATEGIIMLSGYGGDICDALAKNGKDQASGLIESWQVLFPDGRFACELSFGGRQEEESLSLLLAAQAMEAGVPCVAAHPVLFADPGDFEAHEVRTCIADSCRLEDPAREHRHGREQHMPDAAEMQRIFADWPQALDNAAEIAMRCNFDFGLSSQPQYPRVPGVARDKVDDNLKEKATQGLEKIFAGRQGGGRDYMQRLEDELGVITGKGFSDYFLIVAELVRYARENDIPVGPGRGSGAGSLVAYCLGITDVDPIEHGLLFERFLNPERTALPDFDIDFCKDRREMVINHARQVYGDDCVSQVITFGTLRAKAVVRDVCRVLGIPYETGDTISRLIPEQLYITLAEARSEVEELDRMLKGSDELEWMWQFSLALEGLPRQGSTHAAAVLITPRPLVEYCPLIKVGDKGKGYAVSQYDKDAVEAVGLIKFDILGLKNLTMLDMAEKMIRDKVPSFRLSAIDLLDDRMFDVYRSGNTVGIFQCESAGMVSLIKKIAPRSIEDIAVSISLFRPGALNTKMDEKYLSNREDPGRTSYPHESVRKILEPTNGAMIYQEQAMKISQELAGFSLAKADRMRAAIGKKDAASMAALGEDFIAGATGSISKGAAKALFEEIKEFAGYGFNKSHAISYAYISLQTAYLKAHHKAVFFASSLATWRDDPKAQALLLQDVKENNIETLPPDINRSQAQFTAEADDAIRFGLASVRGVGFACAEAIVAARDGQGEFKNMDELCMRVPSLNRNGLVNLVGAGALDCFAKDNDKQAVRATLTDDVEGAFESALHANRNINQENLFGDEAAAPQPKTAATRWSRRKMLVAELTALGATISGRFTETLDLLPNLNGWFRNLGDLEQGGEGTWVGQVTKVITNAKMRKRGQEVFVLDDGATSEVSTSTKDVGHVALEEPGALIVVSGEAKANGDYRPRIVAKRVMDLDRWLGEHLKQVSIDATKCSDDDLAWLLGVLKARNKAGTRVRIKISAGKASVPVDTGQRLELDSETLETIQERLGRRSIDLGLA